MKKVKEITPSLSLHDEIDVRAVRVSENASLFRMEIRHKDSLFREKYKECEEKHYFLNLIPYNIKYNYLNPWRYDKLVDDERSTMRLSVLNTITFLDTEKKSFLKMSDEIKTYSDYKEKCREQLDWLIKHGLYKPYFSNDVWTAKDSDEKE